MRRSAAALGVALHRAPVALTLALWLGVGVAAESSKKPVLGSDESVALVSGDTCLLVDAKIDTGADRSSVDEELAEALGLDLENADTATFSSALGETERPLVEIDVYVAGERLEVEVSVSDRDGLSSDVLVGQDVLVDFLVDVEDENLTDPFGGDEAEDLDCEAFDD